MRYRLTHVTRYSYASPVSLCHSVAHLKPRDTAHQHCESAVLKIKPWPSVVREHRDFFGNRVSYFSIQQSHSELEIKAHSVVEVTQPRLRDLDQALSWEQARRRLQEDSSAEAISARLFVLPSPAIPLSIEAADYARESFIKGRPLWDAVLDLIHRIYTEFEYDPSATDIATPLPQVLGQRCGVCQDFAHLAIAGLRGLGLAARYVSGYLETLPPPGQQKLRGADASHAWLAVYVPGLANGRGWIDLDPTNDCLIGEQHITTAIGRDYQDVTPVRGVFYGGGDHELSVAVDVDRIEPPA